MKYSHDSVAFGFKTIPGPFAPAELRSTDHRPWRSHSAFAMAVRHLAIDSVARIPQRVGGVVIRVIRRLKKRKLQLKDTIGLMQSKLIPDLDA